MTPRASAIRHFICRVTLIINIYGLRVRISTIKKVQGGGHTPPLPEVNFLMVEIPTPKPYIFMIRVTRQIECLIAQAPGVIPHPYLEGTQPLKSSLQVGGGV
jgi:hypothetical protein